MEETSNFVEKSKIQIPFLVVTVGQACNLRCRDCGNFAPFAPRHTLLYEAASIIEQLKILVKFAKVLSLQIQGGEPFIYPQLGTLLEFVRDCPEIERCQLATNGIAIPQVDPELLRHEKMSVRISNYPVAGATGEKLQEWLTAHSIRYRIYHFVSGEDRWFDLGKGRFPTDGAQARFQSCGFRDCLTLEDGLLGHCSRSVIAPKVQGFTVEPEDYVTVLDNEEFGTQLEEYIRNPQYMQACRYCNGTEETAVLEPAIQIGPTEKWEDFQS